jgi:3'-phosphoadenosine 5'-phosphosulfate sulfotransferase (PAPS reductase)/FAD synthetase
MNEYEFKETDAMAKLKQILRKYKNPVVCYSGGSDSDLIMWMLRNNGIHLQAVFYDTGIEYQATKNHVSWMREHHGFDIDVIKPTMPIPTSNKTYGHPFISKRVSDYIERLQRHNFDFKSHGNLNFDELWELYPNAKSALQWWTNGNGNGSSFNISRNKYLKEFIMAEGGIPFRVSGRCCEGAKKKPIKKYAKERGIDLAILGLRRAEGGLRIDRYKSCYHNTKNGMSLFMPLWWMTNADKEVGNTKYEIVNSEAYRTYGLKRTGCAGCPFGRNFQDEVDMILLNEPKLAKGIKNIFSPSYEFTKKYREFIKEIDGVAYGYIQKRMI